LTAVIGASGRGCIDKLQKNPASAVDEFRVIASRDSKVAIFFEFDISQAFGQRTL